MHIGTVLVLSILLVAMTAQGCPPRTEKPNSDGGNNESVQSTFVGVVSPPGQQTFEERFEVSLNLPMEEDKFISLLELLELRFYAEGPDSLNLKHKALGFDFPSRPFLTPDYDMSDITHSYVIDAGFNESKNRLELYLALVRSDRQVVYLENNFRRGLR